MPTSSEWMYFASGAILPTLACYWLWSTSPPHQGEDGGPRQRRIRGAAAAPNSSSPGPNAATSSTGGERPREERTNKKNTSNDDEEDEDGSSEEGSSSSDDGDDNVLLQNGALDCKTWGYTHAPYKMVLVVNHELNMGKGKIAAQCGHASVGCYKRALQKCPRGLQAWEQTGCAKIAVKCPNTTDLLQIAALAKSLGIPSYLVEDAGRTQIAAGSRTVLGLFGPTSVFGPLTDHLKLM